ASHRPRLRCGMGAIGLQSGTLAKVGYQISNPCGRLAASQWKKLVYTQHRACGCRPQAEVITLSAFAPLRPLEKLGLFHISNISHPANLKWGISCETGEIREM